MNDTGTMDTAGGVTTQFVFDRFGHLLEEANSSGTVQKEYIWLDDLPVAMVDATTNTIYFIHTDQLGTPQKITDGSANVVWDGVFDSFGNAITNWGTGVWGSFNWAPTSPPIASTNLRFPGQYADAETALNQNWFRDYDPTTGRYIQSDPIGLDGGVNTYNYVANSPTYFTDFTGLQEILLGRLPPVVENLFRSGEISSEELELPRETIPKQSGKAAADDAPSWCKGQRPMIKESGKDFAKRIMDARYGPGNYDRGPTTEFNRIQKWGDRNFRIPQYIANRLQL